MTMVEALARTSLWLSKLKKRLGFRRPRTEKLSDYDLSKRPFTKAMLLRAAAGTDAAEIDLKAMGTHLKPTREPSSLDERIEDAACSVAFDITTGAMGSIGRGIFMPFETLPDDAQRITAFAFFVIMGLIGTLKKEGYELNFREACIKTLHLFVLIHQENEKKKLYEKSAETFRYIVKNANSNVDEWRESLEKLVYLYVIQWNTEDPDLKKTQFPRLFGSTLKVLLEA